MKKTKKNHSQLGNILAKRKQKQFISSTPAQSSTQLQSYTAKNDISDLFELANEAEKEFTTLQTEVIFMENYQPTLLPQNINISNTLPNYLSIPRRPPWSPNTSAEELHSLENKVFNDWRKEMNSLENQSLFQNSSPKNAQFSLTTSAITPYEKNTEVWKQLWRVIERSNLLVQILDSRHPLLFYNADLYQYATDMGKKFMLLLNKSDLLSHTMREKWSHYLISLNIPFIFFSTVSHISSSDLPSPPMSLDLCSLINSPHILSPRQLFEVLDSFRPPSLEGVDYVVGFCGYPNVGKSSIINLLRGEKKVAVGPTPGKTKHYQTLIVSSLLPLPIKLTLCDSPGLVFPSSGHSHEELICNGILSIDTMGQHRSVMEYLSYLISPFQIKRVYPQLSLTMVSPFSIDEVLDGLCVIKGYSCATLPSSISTLPTYGKIDQAKAARIVLKDLFQGKILLCYPPPNISDQERFEFLQSVEQISPITKDQQEELKKKEEDRQMAKWLEEEKKDQNILPTSRKSYKGNSKAKRRLRKKLHMYNELKSITTNNDNPFKDIHFLHQEYHKMKISGKKV